MLEPPNDLIDLETARRETGATYAAIRSWMRSGKLHAWKRGYYNVISRAELEAVIRQMQSVRPVSPPYAGSTRADGDERGAAGAAGPSGPAGGPNGLG